MAVPLKHMSDEVVQAILAANFDPAALNNRLVDAGQVPKEGPVAFSQAKSLVRSSLDFRARLTGLLDRLHFDRIRDLFDEDEDLLLCFCTLADFRRCKDLGGVIWALARDGRPPVKAALEILLGRVHRQAYRAWQGVASQA